MGGFCAGALVQKGSGSLCAGVKLLDHVAIPRPASLRKRRSMPLLAYAHRIAKLLPGVSRAPWKVHDAAHEYSVESAAD